MPLLRDTEGPGSGVLQQSGDADHSRIGSLDGLRGLAALVVVLHHILLACWPMLALGYAGSPMPTWSAEWWLFATPLHFLWAGPEAVIVFFVLSGFVLALPSIRRDRRWSIAYYPKRLLRLYLPVWAAIVVAVGWRLLVPRTRFAGATWWVQAHVTPMTVHGALVQATLRDQGTWAFDPVLWSLHWEVLYSVLLPALLVPVLLTRRRPVLGLALAAGALATTGWGAATQQGLLAFLPMFIVGALLAVHRQRVADAFGALTPRAATMVGIGATTLLTANYWLHPHWIRSPAAVAAAAGMAKVLAVLSAVALLALALGRPSWAAALQGRTPRWLGSRSYSLYLVHEPVIVTLAFALGAHAAMPFFLLLALAASLAVAELFWRAVERPAIHVARAAGRVVSTAGRVAGVRWAPVASIPSSTGR